MLLCEAKNTHSAINWQKEGEKLLSYNPPNLRAIFICNYADKTHKAFSLSIKDNIFGTLIPRLTVAHSNQWHLCINRAEILRVHSSSSSSYHICERIYRSSPNNSQREPIFIVWIDQVSKCARTFAFYFRPCLLWWNLFICICTCYYNLL